MVGFTGIVDRPISEKFPGDFTPENTKSSGVTDLGFLHGTRFNLDVLVVEVSKFVFGMQKS